MLPVDPGPSFTARRGTGSPATGRNAGAMRNARGVSFANESHYRGRLHLLVDEMTLVVPWPTARLRIESRRQRGHAAACPVLSIVRRWPEKPRSGGMRRRNQTCQQCQSCQRLLCGFPIHAGCANHTPKMANGDPFHHLQDAPHHAQKTHKSLIKSTL